MITENRMPQIADYATPPEICDAERALMGGIDLDPASSHEYNAFSVKASIIYTREDNGLDQPWAGRVHLNPPGGKSKPGPKAWWQRLVEQYERGEVEQACYVSFALDSLQWSQSKGTTPILRWPTVIFGKRIAYYRHETVFEYDGKYYVDPSSPIVLKKGPNRPSALTWLPPKNLSPELVKATFTAFRSMLAEIGYPCVSVLEI